MTPSQERRLHRCYRAVLRCYPPSFRSEYGVEMAEAFVDQLRAARRGRFVHLLAFVLVAFADAMASGTRERFSTLSSGAGMFHWMDVRYAFRLLRRSPLFTVLTVLVLSGGLGVSIFTFSFLHTAMLKPLPVADGQSIVRITRQAGSSSGPFDVADLADMRRDARTVKELGAYTSQSMVIDDVEHPRVIDVTVAEWDMFGFTRTLPAMGRAFTRGDAMPGAEPVIVLGYRTWMAVFGGDSAMLGRTLLLNGVRTRVVGVMPQGYGFPVASSAWMPLPTEHLTARERGRTFVELYGRLVPGTTSERVQRELTALYQRARANARASVGTDSARALAAVDAITIASVESFPMAQVGEEGPLILTVLNVLAGLILLLACINVTNLLLARSNERVRETAVRLALGASRGRLIMQSMWESILLCTAGGAVATAIAAWGLDAINSWARVNLEGNLAFWWVWGLDRSSLMAAALFVTATIGVLGVAVSVRATSLQFVAVLKDGSTRSGSRREGRVARVLVITQVATVSLLMFFGVMSGIAAYRIANVDPGFDTRRLLSASIDLDAARYGEAEPRNQLFANVLQSLNNSPAIDGALVRTNLASITDDNARVSIDAAPPGEARAYQIALTGAVSALGLTVTRGRSFDSRDGARSAPVAIVSHAFAERYWRGVSPLGRSVTLTGDGLGVSRLVVGVISDMVHGAPLSNSRSAVAVYVPLEQQATSGAEIVFRHRGSAGAAQGALYQALRAADARLQPPEVRSYDEILDKTALIAKSTAKLFGACFAFALLIAVSGTYGLMARSIGQRTREIGVRRALGASDNEVIRLLLRQGTRQLGIGVMFSLPLMLLVGVGFAQKFPSGVGVGLTIASGVIVSLTIVMVVLLATYVPTRRAIAVELREALWSE